MTELDVTYGRLVVGALDDIKGKAKEALGSVTGSDDLRKEGQAQQQKSAEELRSQEARMEAQKHEEKADAHERREAGHQGS
jgi:uncharacterized protein YjbJ (UPF0337 family)